MTMATSAVMIGLMPGKGTKTPSCSLGQVQKGRFPRSKGATEGLAGMGGGQYHQPGRANRPVCRWGVSCPIKNSSVHPELLAAFKHYGERLLRHSQIGSEPERLRIHVS